MLVSRNTPQDESSALQIQVSIPTLMDLGISQVSRTTLIKSADQLLGEQARELFIAKHTQYENLLRTFMTLVRESEIQSVKSLLITNPIFFGKHQAAYEYYTPEFAEIYVAFFKILSSTNMISDEMFLLIVNCLSDEDVEILKDERIIDAANLHQWKNVEALLQQRKLPNKTLLSKLIKIAVAQQSPTKLNWFKDAATPIIFNLLNLGADPTAVAIEAFHSNDQKFIIWWIMVATLAIHAHDHELIQQTFLTAERSYQFKIIFHYLRKKNYSVPINTNLLLKIANHDREQAVELALTLNVDAVAMQTTFLSANTNHEWLFVFDYLSKIDKEYFDTVLLEQVVTRAVKLNPDFLVALIRCGIPVTPTHLEKAFAAKLPKTLEKLLQEAKPTVMNTPALMHAWMQDQPPDWTCVEVYLLARPPNVSVLVEMLTTLINHNRVNQSKKYKVEGHYIIRCLSRFNKHQFTSDLLEGLMTYAIQSHLGITYFLIHFGISVTLAHVEAAFKYNLPETELKFLLEHIDKDLSHKNVLLQAAKRGNTCDWEFINVYLHFKWPDQATLATILEGASNHTENFLNACSGATIAKKFHPEFLRLLFLREGKTNFSFAASLINCGLIITKECLEFAFTTHYVVMTNLLDADPTLRNDDALLKFIDTYKWAYTCQVYLEKRKPDYITARKLWLLHYKNDNAIRAMELEHLYDSATAIADHHFFLLANTPAKWHFILCYLRNYSLDKFAVVFLENLLFHAIENLSEINTEKDIIESAEGKNLATANLELCIFLITSCTDSENQASMFLSSRQVEAALRKQSSRVLQHLLSANEIIEHNAALLIQAQEKHWLIVHAYLQIRKPNAATMKALFHLTMLDDKTEMAMMILTRSGIILGTKILHEWQQANPGINEHALRRVREKFESNNTTPIKFHFFKQHVVSHRYSHDAYGTEDVFFLFNKWLRAVLHSMSIISKYSTKGTLLKNCMANVNASMLVNKTTLCKTLAWVICLSLQRDRFNISFFSSATTTSSTQVLALLNDAEYQIFKDLILGIDKDRAVTYNDLRTFVDPKNELSFNAKNSDAVYKKLNTAFSDIRQNTLSNT